MIGTPADARALETHTHWKAVRAFHVEFHQFPTPETGQEQELVLGGEKLPVQEVAQLPAVYGEKLGAGNEP